MREPFHRECFYVTGTHFLFKKTMPGPNFFDFWRTQDCNARRVGEWLLLKQMIKEKNVCGAIIIIDDQTCRCHQIPFIGAHRIQEPVILCEPHIITSHKWRTAGSLSCFFFHLTDRPLIEKEEESDEPPDSRSPSHFPLSCTSWSIITQQRY